MLSTLLIMYLFFSSFSSRPPLLPLLLPLPLPSSPFPVSSSLFLPPPPPLYFSTSSYSSSSSFSPTEINLKQQLVDQLEKAQRNLYTMKQQYEEKMQLLQQQIRSVESERDKVLKEISKCANQHKDV